MSLFPKLEIMSFSFFLPLTLFFSLHFHTPPSKFFQVPSSINLFLCLSLSGSTVHQSFVPCHSLFKTIFLSFIFALPNFPRSSVSPFPLSFAPPPPVILSFEYFHVFLPVFYLLPLFLFLHFSIFSQISR